MSEEPYKDLPVGGKDFSPGRWQMIEGAVQLLCIALAWDNEAKTEDWRVDGIEVEHCHREDSPYDRSETPVDQRPYHRTITIKIRSNGKTP